MREEREEVLSTLLFILQDLGISEEELLNEKFYCIRQFKADAETRGQVCALYLSIDNKEEYPKEKILDDIPWYCCGKEYAYERDERETMWDVYKTYLYKKDIVSDENIHKACYDIVEMLYDGLMRGFAYNILETGYYKSQVSKRIKDYLFENNYGQNNKQTRFTTLDDSVGSLLKLKTIEDLKKYTADEIKKSLNKRCFFVFKPTEVSIQEIAKEQTHKMKTSIKIALSNIKNDELKTLFVKELKEFLDTVV